MKMRSIVLMLFLTLTAPSHAADTITGPLTMAVSTQKKILVVRIGGTEMRRYTVAVGTKAKPTPMGQFTVKHILWNPSWHPPDEKWAKGKKPAGPGDPKNPMKVVKIFFQEPDYYIHGTDQVESLGSAASHGCLRMDPAEVADLAKLVMEHGGEPREENWFWRIIHSRREEKTVYLSNPVTLTISG
jgi:lipoprotein-anchoring transpeptidase ErfK/SrfK